MKNRLESDLIWGLWDRPGDQVLRCHLVVGQARTTRSRAIDALGRFLAMVVSGASLRLVICRCFHQERKYGVGMGCPSGSPHFHRKILPIVHAMTAIPLWLEARSLISANNVIGALALGVRSSATVCRRGWPWASMRRTGHKSNALKISNKSLNYDAKPWKYFRAIIDCCQNFLKHETFWSKAEVCLNRLNHNIELTSRISLQMPSRWLPWFPRFSGDILRFHHHRRHRWRRLHSGHLLSCDRHLELKYSWKAGDGALAEFPSIIRS